MFSRNNFYLLPAQNGTPIPQNASSPYRGLLSDRRSAPKQATLRILVEHRNLGEKGREGASRSEKTAMWRGPKGTKLEGAGRQTNGRQGRLRFLGTEED